LWHPSQPKIAEIHSEDYTSILQASLPAPLVDIEKEQPKEDNTEDFRVYMKGNFTEPLPKEEVKPLLQEFSVPSPHVSPRIDSSKMTEYPRQEFFSAPSPPV
jgi:hypothetical protein